MKTKGHLSTILLIILCFTAFLIPFLSWMLAAFDLPVNSLLSDEGWRWTFTHGMDALWNYGLQFLILLLTMIGVLEYLFTHSLGTFHRKAFYVSSSVGLFFLCLLLMAALLPQSPLLGLTGRLRYSPFVYGFPLALCLIVIVSSFIYGLMTRCIQSFDDFADFVSYGLHRHAIWIIVAMMISYQYQCLLYILN